MLPFLTQQYCFCFIWQGLKFIVIEEIVEEVPQFAKIRLPVEIQMLNTKDFEGVRDMGNGEGNPFSTALGGILNAIAGEFPLYALVSRSFEDLGELLLGIGSQF